MLQYVFMIGNETWEEQYALLVSPGIPDWIVDSIVKFNLENHLDFNLEMFIYNGLPKKILYLLINNELSENIRLEMARSPNLSSVLMQKLMEDESANVRHALIGNQITPREIIENLTSDESQIVKEAALRVLTLLDTPF